MANPRKFSEKIALHTHRQAEETARFEQIMKEVSDATARPEDMPHMHSHSHSNTYYRESRPRSQGGPIRRQDRKHDTSPYSGPFLSPPPDTSWRRTNSDSALHQSAMQGMNNERNDNSNSRWMLNSVNGPEQHDGRPRSSCDIPRVNIYPIPHEPGTVQIPIGNNTGSLPDLTSVHFPSPIHAPLDQEHDQGSSPYSSSPVNTSPSTLSPTSAIPGNKPHQQARFQFTNPPVSTNQTHLTVPANSRYLPQNKGVVIDNNLPSLDGSEYISIGTMNQMYQQQPPATSPSPTLQQVAGYRSPRPSPNSSPSLGGRHSAPCSPGAPSPLPNDYHMFNSHQTAQLQQHFEAFSMIDPPNYGMDQNATIHLTPSPTLPDVQDVGSIDINNDPYYGSFTPSLHTTPNTPTSIPNIILTDFSGTDDMSRQDISKQLEAELLNETTLRESLEPLDFDGIAMLANDPSINLIPDGVEDHFRLDRS